MLKKQLFGVGLVFLPFMVIAFLAIFGFMGDMSEPATPEFLFLSLILVVSACGISTMFLVILPKDYKKWIERR